MTSRHQADLEMCLKLPGIHVGKLCEKCDGRCPVCDSLVRPTTEVRICDECAFGNTGEKCILCGLPGISDAYYCFECTRTERDRDGCPRILNIGSSKSGLYYEHQKKRTEGRIES